MEAQEAVARPAAAAEADPLDEHGGKREGVGRKITIERVAEMAREAEAEPVV
jgi:hypothetical protein